jgi:hypothetical protein
MARVCLHPTDKQLRFVSSDSSYDGTMCAVNSAPYAHMLPVPAGWALAKQHQELDELGVAVEKAAAAAAAAAAAGSNAAAGRDLSDIDADLQAAESQLKHAEIGRDDLVKRHSKVKVRDEAYRGRVGGRGS